MGARKRLRTAAWAWVLTACWGAGAGWAGTNYYVNGALGDDGWDGLAAAWDGWHGPKATIQAAVTGSASGDSVIVADGVYSGSGNYEISFYNKALTVRSEHGAKQCVIDGQGLGRGFALDQIADGNAVVEGFTIRGGWANRGGGIYCRDSNAVIRGCVIEGNAANSYGGGIYCEGGDTVVSRPRIEHNVIVGNRAGGPGGGVGMYYNVEPTIANNVIAGNSSSAWGGGIGLFPVGYSAAITENTVTGNTAPSGGGMGIQATDAVVSNCIVWGNTGGAAAIRTFGDIYPGRAWVEYSDMEDGETGVTTEAGCGVDWHASNIAADPLFAAAGHWEGTVWVDGDYHLQSQAGRWDAASGQWVNDGTTSRCVGAGNPGTDPNAEAAATGNERVSLGAYGRTNQASRSPTGWSLRADLDNSGAVNLIDLALLSGAWLAQEMEEPADVNRDGAVNAQDLALVAEQWLAQTVWQGVVLRADVNGDGRVNLQDFGVLGSQWLLSGSGFTGDVNGDGTVDVGDLGVLAEEWLGKAG